MVYRSEGNTLSLLFILCLLEELKMASLENIRKFKRRRKILKRVGGVIAFIGFILILLSSGEGEVSMSFILTCGLTGTALFGIGINIVNFVDRIDEEYPLVYKDTTKGEYL